MEGEEPLRLRLRLAPDVRDFVRRCGGRRVAGAWAETGVPPPAPHLVAAEGGRLPVAALARTPGTPPASQTRQVEVYCVPDAFASFEGLLFSLAADPPVLSATKNALELARMLEDARPGDVRLEDDDAGWVGGRWICLRPRALVLGHVLRGLSRDPRSLNPFYDEVRTFGNDAPRGSRYVHMHRLAPVIRSFSSNFLHLLAGTLPLALALAGRVPAGTTFLVYDSPLVRWLLPLAGIAASSMMPFEVDCVYHADELFVVAGLNELADLPARETVARLRGALAPALAPTAVPAAPALVLVDRRGGERRLTNAQDVERAVQAAARPGYEMLRVALETLAPEAQFRLMGRCRLLVGAEGAGLAHALSMPRGASVVNILPTRSRFGPLPSQDGYGYFHHICAQRTRDDIQYYAVACPDFDWDSPALRCPIRGLREVLEAWAESEEAVAVAA